MQEASSGNHAPQRLGADEIVRMIDHTALKPEATVEDVEQLCREAREFNLCSVCVNPSHVRQAKQALADSAVKVCCVVAFPLGAAPPESKAMEAQRAIRDGAAEIDMLVNIEAIKSGDSRLVERNVHAVAEVCRKGSARLKVILETCLLSDEEKINVCQICRRAGADFVKTSTGFSSAGAIVEDIALMACAVASDLRVKTSGGIRICDDAVAMIGAGATRLGASGGVQIIREARKLEFDCQP